MKPIGSRNNPSVVNRGAGGFDPRDPNATGAGGRVVSAMPTIRKTLTRGDRMNIEQHDTVHGPNWYRRKET